MKEKDITAAVLKVAKEYIQGSAAIEIKICKVKSLSFKALEDHQKRALWSAKHDSLVFKIPDMGYRNPMDAFLLKGSAAYVVVVFWQPRVLKEAIFIDINIWVKEENKSVRKSLTLIRAREIGHVERF